MILDKNNSSPFSVRPLFFVVVFAMLSGGNAQAYSAVNACIDACFGSAACSFHQGQDISLCESGRDRCVRQCKENTSQESAAPTRVTGAYGAIAYDEKSGAWGMSDASQDKSSAKKSALAYCSKRGNDCEIVESFSKACAAVATGTGNRLGWAVEDNPKQAGLDAIKKCGDSGTSGKSSDKSRCFMQLYHCYFP